jgi:hypothetical protein
MDSLGALTGRKVLPSAANEKHNVYESSYGTADEEKDSHVGNDE